MVIRSITVFQNVVCRNFYPASTADNSFLNMFAFVCVEVLRPSQPNGIMSSVVSLPNHAVY